MDYQVSIRYTQKLMESVSRRDLAKGCIGLMLLAGFVSLVVLAFSATDQTKPSACYIPGGLILGAGLGSFVFGYFWAKREARVNVRKWGEAQVVYNITYEILHITTPQGQMDYPWRVFDRLEKRKDVWLLFYDRRRYLILPAAQMQGEVGEFLVAKVRENGGKVK
jgi:hypothetical protein